MWLTMLESRAPLEYANWRLSQPLLKRLPRGDGHPVLVLPGFTASDRSTTQMRLLLRHLGYRTYGWRLGPNIGPTRHIVDGLAARVSKIGHHNPGQPISLIGWSLGGIFARYLASERPELFRQVITLGSPFNIRPGDTSAASPLWDSVSPLHDPSFLTRFEGKRQQPLEIPATSIYSRGDGVVRWQLCLESRGPMAENVQVIGSHSGLGVNTSVALVVTDRLAQPIGEWRHFRAPLWAKAAFPRPKSRR